MKQFDPKKVKTLVLFPGDKSDVTIKIDNVEHISKIEIYVKLTTYEDLTDNLPF